MDSVASGGIQPFSGGRYEEGADKLITVTEIPLRYHTARYSKPTTVEGAAGNVGCLERKLSNLDDNIKTQNQVLKEKGKEPLTEQQQMLRKVGILRVIGSIALAVLGVVLVIVGIALTAGAVMSGGGILLILAFVAVFAVGIIAAVSAFTIAEGTDVFLEQQQKINLDGKQAIKEINQMKEDRTETLEYLREARSEMKTFEDDLGLSSSVRTAIRGSVRLYMYKRKIRWLVKRGFTIDEIEMYKVDLRQILLEDKKGVDDATEFLQQKRRKL